MNKDLMRAYFRAYRARITDLEAEVVSYADSLVEADTIHQDSESKMRTRISCMEDDLRNREFDQWRLEDRIKDLERR